MTRIGKMTSAALAGIAALGAAPASAVTISNPTGGFDLGSLSGSLTGGQQTQYIGQSFTTPISGNLTNFQFTLTSSTLQSLYGVVYALNGTTVGTEIWRSANISNPTGLVSFNPTGVALTQGQSYVAFLSTFGIANNSGGAQVSTCLSFSNCTNVNPALGTVFIGNVLGNGVNFNPIVNNSRDATFSVTIDSPVPEPTTWAMMIVGMGAVGVAMRRRQKVRVSYAA